MLFMVCSLPKAIFYLKFYYSFRNVHSSLPETALERLEPRVPALGCPFDTLLAKFPACPAAPARDDTCARDCVLEVPGACCIRDGDCCMRPPCICIPGFIEATCPCLDGDTGCPCLLGGCACLDGDGLWECVEGRDEVCPRALAPDGCGNKEHA